ncbi:GNAT family N-acetyltransferase [Phytomonospora endophytica]|uniref:RimJ/RimL family protein N-acetyltransferase n=1 Tax=Phytomonospora endophytica TaxID=714109 RepID=A0A841FYH7_9ACTN|nr:GNAT family N-acetyltransferase [Phytomonospora endophytica]MBB6037020.1 RimJ/RimL family protein N-acetyltransferase [Phytomonospora endophytica]GIG69436.1 acetyltransferase [Phytomonospora endophytica]
MPRLLTPHLAPGSLAERDQPDITADDITLRPWRLADAADVTGAFTDSAIRVWHARSMDEGEAEAWIASWRKRWNDEADAGWAITGAGGLLGQISLRHIALEEGIASISYWVLPAARGRRVAPRALTALTGWAFGTLGLHRLQLEHSTANDASCRVAVKAGFPAEGTRRGGALHADGHHDMHLHARLATDPSPDA